MEHRIKRVLLSLAADLDASDIRYQLGGSGLLHALGLTDTVRDLDLVFPEDAKAPLAALLRDRTGAEPDFRADQESGFHSAWRCILLIDGVEVDMSGGVAFEHDGETFELPFDDGAAWELDGYVIPLAPRSQWVQIYRHHNPSKAELLADLGDEM